MENTAFRCEGFEHGKYERVTRNQLTLMVLEAIPVFSSASVSLSGFIFSSSNTRSMLCRELRSNSFQGAE